MNVAGGRAEPCPLSLPALTASCGACMWKPEKHTRIHVNAQNLRKNAKHPRTGQRKPVFIAHGNEKREGNLVVIEGPARLVYAPDDPLKSGAVAWIETEAKVEVFE